jgi:penicillin-binding protein 2
VFDDEIPPEMLQNIHETFPGSGEATIPLSVENWQIITDAMANVTSSPIGTAYIAHLDGVDFAGKTGTADVVGGRVKNSTNKSTIPNAWFVGMTPRRNPDIVVAVLWEHGYWGNNSAKLAAQVINAFVTKQRKRDNNLRIADTPQPATPQPAPTAVTAKSPIPTAE